MLQANSSTQLRNMATIEADNSKTLVQKKLFTDHPALLVQVLSFVLLSRFIRAFMLLLCMCVLCRCINLSRQFRCAWKRCIRRPGQEQAAFARRTRAANHDWTGLQTMSGASCHKTTNALFKRTTFTCARSTCKRIQLSRSS